MIMSRKITVFLVSAKPNPRINKRIELASQYSEVHLIFWNRCGVPNKYFNSNCIVHEINIKVGDSIVRRMPYYLSFKRSALRELSKIKGDIIHVQGLDMLNIAYNYIKKNNSMLIYEVPDLPHLLIDKNSNVIISLLQRYLNSLENKCIKFVDLLIVTSPKFTEVRYKNMIADDKIFYFPNVPNLKYFRDYDRNKYKHSVFTVSFIGAVRYKRQMMNLLECAQRSSAEYLIAGFESSGNEIEECAKTISNVRWYGEYRFEKEASKLYAMSDIIYSVYDADSYNVRVALPNKLYEAVFCEIPIIVARGTYLADVVNEWGVGIAVDCNNIDELCNAIEVLQNDREYYQSLVDNCKKHKKECELQFYNSMLKAYIEKEMD